jgi:hypothetical protein
MHRDCTLDQEFHREQMALSWEQGWEQPEESQTGNYQNGRLRRDFPLVVCGA